MTFSLDGTILASASSEKRLSNYGTLGQARYGRHLMLLVPSTHYLSPTTVPTLKLLEDPYLSALFALLVSLFPTNDLPPPYLSRTNGCVAAGSLSFGFPPSIAQHALPFMEAVLVLGTLPEE